MSVCPMERAEPGRGAPATEELRVTEGVLVLLGVTHYNDDHHDKDVDAIRGEFRISYVRYSVKWTKKLCGKPYFLLM